MAKQFTDDEWSLIENHLEDKDGIYGLPQFEPGTVVFASWNIRKFGAELNDDGNPKRSAGAFRMMQRFCERCDFIAIQETQDDLWSARHLRDRLNEANPQADFKLISSDITGRAPGKRGLGERFVFLYNSKTVEPGEIASDLSFDQSAILENVNNALRVYRDEVLDEETGDGMAEKALAWIQKFTGFNSGKLPSFFQFIRAPHMVTFRVKGTGEEAYEIGCVNAHLLSGREVEREREFFMLLEWLVRRSGINGIVDAPITLLMGDLNLSFDSSNDARRDVIEEYVKGINKKKPKDAPRVNFPFLSTPPGREPIRTNSRETETFDHIAWFSRDDRLPRGRHNILAGNDGFDYGMYNFLKLFRDAGPGLTDDGDPAYEKFEHDFSDHMPIWVRLPVPSAGQKRYVIDE